jgi:hypothetical protein
MPNMFKPYKAIKEEIAQCTLISGSNIYIYT